MVPCRDVQTQAIYALKGKPLNTHGLGRETVYKNEELYNIMRALGIEDDLEDLDGNPNDDKDDDPDDGNAGGSSLLSEVFAYEVLHRCEGATLLKTETDAIPRTPSAARDGE